MKTVTKKKFREELFAHFPLIQHGPRRKKYGGQTQEDELMNLLLFFAK
jgi:hypothetical protein